MSFAVFIQSLFAELDDDLLQNLDLFLDFFLFDKDVLQLMDLFDMSLE